MAKNIPAFTAGGSNEAEIATPTKLLAFSPRTLSATPTPEGTAIATPLWSKIRISKLAKLITYIYMAAQPSPL